MNDRIGNRNKKYDLKEDGFILLKNVLNEGEIDYIKNNCIENDNYNVKSYIVDNYKIRNKLITTIGNNDYIFQDYILIIKKSSVHTCHRDYNGDFFNKGQQYPSYTFIIYLEDMEKGLGVIPSSHKSVNSYNINLTNSIINIPCKSGDILLFNSNLIHVGGLNENPDNLRIQMKLTHKDDIEHIAYYENYNKVLNKDNNLPFILKKIQKNASCMFPGISNLTQSENVKMGNQNNKTNLGLFEKLYSYIFYGNANFYDLPNAF
jgi:ectoine hydroxylase-related dioxygenase (phytanoyl-CoA dioxygenase family)